MLDQDFFALRMGGLTDREVQYVKALASLGPGEQTPADIAHARGEKSSTKIGNFSRRLTERGLIYSSRRGRVAFAVRSLTDALPGHRADCRHPQPTPAAHDGLPGHELTTQNLLSAPGRTLNPHPTTLDPTPRYPE